MAGPSKKVVEALKAYRELTRRKGSGPLFMGVRPPERRGRKTAGPNAAFAEGLWSHVYWLEKGHELRQAGLYEEAVKAYDRSLGKRPNNASALDGKGVALDSLGRSEEAMRSLRRAISLDPNVPEGWYHYGACLDALDRRGQAVKAYAKAIDLDPDHFAALIRMAFDLHRIGRPDEGDKAFDHVIRTYPDLAAEVRAQRPHASWVPAGLTRCRKCGEYRGRVRDRDLNWTGTISEESAKDSDLVLEVLCWCNNVPCPRCGKGQIRRPGSNYYCEAENRAIHVSIYAGSMGSCDKCDPRPRGELRCSTKGSCDKCRRKER